MVTLACGDWRLEGVAVAASFRDRLVGLRRPHAAGMLFHTSSVHGAGLTEPLRLIHLSRSGMVTGREHLRVGGLVRSLDYWVLEGPLTKAPPPIGAQLAVVLPSSLR